MGDMEVETEPNVDGQYGEYVKEVEVKKYYDVLSLCFRLIHVMI